MNSLLNVEKIVYNGVNYTILDFLENALLLVVETEHFEKGLYPLNPLVIPNEL